MKTFWKRPRFWISLCFPLALLLTLFASASTSFAEWYATAVYPALSRFGNYASGAVPYSLAELSVFLVVFGFLVCLVRLIVRLIRRRGEWKSIVVRAFSNLFCFVSVIFLLFVLNCGVNYHRIPFSQSSGLPVQNSSIEELTFLCESLAKQANRLRAGLPEDDNGGMAWRYRSYREAANQAKIAFDALSAQYSLLPGGYGAPKPVLFSRAMSLCGITGVFIPFTMEANVNVDVPLYTIPATMCHELSHLRGFMREDEANFLGYLACKASDEAEFQYSGNMLAFLYANNALFEADKEAASKIYGGLSDGVRRDFAINSAYWKQFEGPVSDVASSVNNAYLKANDQPDGVKSYGRMVDLLLAEQRAAHNP